MEVPMSQKSTAKPGPLKRWGPLGVLLGLVGLAFAMGWHEQFSLSNLIKHREELHAYVGNNFWFSVLSYIGLYIVATALLFPAASLITIAGGLVFGSILATSLTLVGATIGATILFLVVRTSFGSVLSERAGPFLVKLADGFKENAFSYLLFSAPCSRFPILVDQRRSSLFQSNNSHLYHGNRNRYFARHICIFFIGGRFGFADTSAQEKANPGCADAGTCEIDLTAAITPQIICRDCWIDPRIYSANCHQEMAS